MLLVTVRRDRIHVRGPLALSGPYSPAGARVLAWLCRRPPLLAALLPLLQDVDPELAAGLAALSPAELCALAAALSGAGDQLVEAADWLPDDRVSLAAPAPLDGCDAPPSGAEPARP